jgi:hypothetical protein
MHADLFRTLNNQLPGTPEPLGEGGSTINFFATQTFFGSVKKPAFAKPPSSCFGVPRATARQAPRFAGLFISRYKCFSPL